MFSTIHVFLGSVEIYTFFSIVFQISTGKLWEKITEIITGHGNMMLNIPLMSTQNEVDTFDENILLILEFREKAVHCEFLEYWNTQKCLEDLTTFFMSTWWGDSKNIEEIEFSRWLFEGRPRQGKNVLPDGLNWLCYFVGSSKSHRENSISCIFLESPHQVDMKHVVKSSKHVFGYFKTLETHRENL